MRQKVAEAASFLPAHRWQPPMLMQPLVRPPVKLSLLLPRASPSRAEHAAVVGRDHLGRIADAVARPAWHAGLIAVGEPGEHQRRAERRRLLETIQPMRQHDERALRRAHSESGASQGGPLTLGVIAAIQHRLHERVVR